MSIAHNQLRVARELWTRLQPLDRGVPTRLQTLLSDRRFGSRDRRLYRDLLFTALRLARRLPDPAVAEGQAWAAALAAGCADTRETAAFRAAFTDPELRPPDPLDLVPTWFTAECPTGPTHPSPAALAAALLRRAPVWVRLQTDTPAVALAEWAERGWNAEPHPTLPDARRLPPETNVAGCAAYQAGHYEVQDLGSQLILASLAATAAAPGPRWLDLCAGAGGKTLQLARLLGPAGRVLASDVRPAPLAELLARARRAGLADRIRTAAPGDLGTESFDGVLVDAPCSGSGTWRRAPHLMACTRAEDLAAAAVLQRRILDEAAPRVRRGGWLVYATCSFARSENEAVAAGFLAGQDGRFESLPPPYDHGFPRTPLGLDLLPGAWDNDGFHVAAFRRV